MLTKTGILFPMNISNTKWMCALPAKSVFYHNHRIASHVRIYGEKNDPVVLPEHMPYNHKQYLAWNGERFLEWARSVGPNTEAVMQTFRR
jgi:hypothetical protein